MLVGLVGREESAHGWGLLLVDCDIIVEISLPVPTEYAKVVRRIYCYW